MLIDLLFYMFFKLFIFVVTTLNPIWEGWHKNLVYKARRPDCSLQPPKKYGVKYRFGNHIKTYQLTAEF